MFGYVLPSKDRLSEEEQADFQSVYCGLCRTLRRHYGAASTLILNYDLTFLAVMLSSGERPETEHCHCAAHPCRGRCAACETDALRRAAAYSVILAYWQLRDGVADGGFWKSLVCRLASFLLRRAYRRAAADAPAFDEGTREHLAALDALERRGCATLDEPADAFAALLAGAAEELTEPVQRRIFSQLFYHMGRWIYLVDAADDWKDDARSGSYNPLIGRYGLADGVWPEESRRAFSQTLDHSIRAIAAAFELWDFGCWDGLLRSTFYEGMYQVGNAVLEGTFRRRSRGRNEIKRSEDTI